MFGLKSNFLPFNDRKGGKKPTYEGMKEYLGSILFVCMFLEGRVKPTGRFKSCIVEVDEGNGWKQPVNFDIPLSSGIVSSTLAMKTESFRRLTLI